MGTALHIFGHVWRSAQAFAPDEVAYGELKAASRFQAGVEAVRAGLL